MENYRKRTGNMSEQSPTPPADVYRVAAKRLGQLERGEVQPVDVNLNAEPPADVAGLIEDGWRHCAVGQGTSQFCPQSERLAAELDALKHDVERHMRIVSECEAERDALREALEAIIARWDTPLWRDAEPTGAVINRARAALARAKENSRG